MRALHRMSFAVAALLPAAVAAQQVSFEPTAAQRCLQLADGAKNVIEYPFEQLKRLRGGRVLVQLTFSKADAMPALEVVEREGDEAFVDAVARHVRQLRVPCLRPDEGPVTLRQEYRCKPEEHQVAAVDSHPQAERRQRLAACLMHTSGALRPDYPFQALRANLQGRVLLKLHFDAADRAPEVRALFRPRAEPLADATIAFAAGYRLPCLEGGPVSLNIQYNYAIEGEAYGFRSATLLRIIGIMKNIRKQRVFFDMGTMGCPFDVTFTYWQPQGPNTVTAKGAPDPRRDPLLQWLRDAEFDLRDRQLDAIFGDIVSFTVPCGKIDLQPQE